MAGLMSHDTPQRRESFSLEISALLSPEERYLHSFFLVQRS